MALPNTPMSFTPLDPLPAASLNDIVENVEALAAGTGLNDSVVTASKLATGAASAAVNTSETSGSTSYVDLATVGPSVTVTIGANGMAWVTLTADVDNSSGTSFTFYSFVASGANTIAASNDRAIIVPNGRRVACSWTYLATGLTPGSTTFKAQYSVTAGTGTWQRRYISVIPL